MTTKTPAAPAGAKAFVLAPGYNSPGKKDATGAFQTEAQGFVKAHGLDAQVRLFDNRRNREQRRVEVGTAIDRCVGQNIPVWAFFCHGWKNGLQVGWRADAARDLATRIAAASTKDATVILYACDAARDLDADSADDRAKGPGGDGGFASCLYTALTAAGVRGALWAHSTTGHCTTNPWVRVWRDGLPTGVWAVEPHSPRWAKWCTLLRTTTFRYRFPFSADLDGDLDRFKV